MIGLVKLNDKVADFGAEQVILVRDDISKDKLQTQIGEIALVLTILESKGMEFDDVLVYDFFGSSGLGSSYRCLYMLAQASRAQFDYQKHAVSISRNKISTSSGLLTHPTRLCALNSRYRSVQSLPFLVR